MKKKIMILSIIAVMVVLTIIAIHAMNTLTTFSIKRWDTNVYQREWMLSSFLEKYELVGMSSEEVTELLGTNEFDGNKYLIGKSYVGPMFFSITFDENDRVKSYGIIVD